uniref:Uncharacterized protein n=1 Tax=Anopheles farauti TaxID=69004 RepID=A0A182QHW1_9DIPT
MNIPTHGAVESTLVRALSHEALKFTAHIIVIMIIIIPPATASSPTWRKFAKALPGAGRGDKTSVYECGAAGVGSFTNDDGDGGGGGQHPSNGPRPTPGSSGASCDGLDEV